jgi:hypothetical protein
LNPPPPGCELSVIVGFSLYSLGSHLTENTSIAWQLMPFIVAYSLELGYLSTKNLSPLEDVYRAVAWQWVYMLYYVSSQQICIITIDQQLMGPIQFQSHLVSLDLPNGIF